MKRLLGLLMICIWLISCSVGAHPTPEQLLAQTFQSLGFTAEEYVLHEGSRTAEPLTHKQVKQLVQQLATAFHTSPVYTQIDENGIQYTSFGTIGRNLTIALHVIDDRPEQPSVQPYLSLQVIGHGKPGQEWTDASSLCAEVLQAHDIVPHFHYAIQGVRTRLLETSAVNLNQPISQAFQQLNASEIESMHTSQTVSISAYSPLLPGGLQTGGGVMNIQAATRVNPDTHQLMLTLGTPIITIEY